MNPVIQNFTVKLFFSVIDKNSNVKHTTDILSCRDLRITQLEGVTLVALHCVNGTDEDHTYGLVRDRDDLPRIINGEIPHLKTTDFTLKYYSEKGYFLNKVVVENMKGVNTQVIPPTSVLALPTK